MKILSPIPCINVYKEHKLIMSITERNKWIRIVVDDSSWGEVRLGAECAHRMGWTGIVEVINEPLYMVLGSHSGYMDKGEIMGKYI